MPVITIARQYGAGGLTVGRLLADELGAELVDKDLIAEVARRAQLPDEVVAAADERPAQILDRVVASFGPLVSMAGAAWDVPSPDHSRSVVLELTRRVLLELARSGNAVIIGRGAAIVLKDRHDATHVFLYADEEVRVETVMARELVSADVARRRIRKMDAARAAYLRQVYGVERRDPRHYALLLNTGMLGHRRTAAIILAAAAGH